MDKLIEGANHLGFRFTPAQVKQFELYYRELVVWNERINLTTILAWEEVQTRHFLDSLTVALAMPKEMPGSFQVLDVGTGGGFPGVPLKIMMPDMKLALLDSTAKKTEFLKDLLSKLEINDVAVISERAEDLARQNDYREGFDLVISRALAPMATVAELTLPLCKVGGLTVTQKKGDIAQELSDASVAIDVMGGRLKELKKVTLKELADERSLVSVEKTRHTPGQYPRRAGIPNKRPIVQK